MLLLLACSSCIWIDRVSVDLQVSPPDGGVTDRPDLSADGRFVVYQSTKAFLVPRDDNGAADIFVHDNRSGVTERVSVDSAGSEADGPSGAARLSEDGRFVVFESSATNLVADDTDGAVDVFVHDRETEVTRRVSDASVVPARNPDISADGRFIVFETGTLNVPLLQFPSVLRHDRTNDTTVTVAGGLTGSGPFGATIPSISDDGRYVAYTARRVAGGPTGFTVPVASVRDLATTDPPVVIADPGGDAVISGDGNWITFDVDLLDGSPQQTYIADRATRMPELVSITLAGAPGEEPSGTPSVSDDGRYVGFHTTSDDVVDQDTDGVLQAFVRDRATGRTTLVSRDAIGMAGDRPATRLTIADDGRYAAFTSLAADLTPGDQSDTYDVFVTAVTEPTVSTVNPTALGRGTSATLVITGTGFRAPASVGVVGQQDVTFGTAVVVSETRIEVPVTIAAGATPATRTLLVIDLGTGPGRAALAAASCACLRVSP